MTTPFFSIATNSIESILWVISIETHHILPLIEFSKYTTAVKNDMNPFMFVTNNEVRKSFFPSKSVFLETRS